MMLECLQIQIYYQHFKGMHTAQLEPPFVFMAIWHIPYALSSCVPSDEQAIPSLLKKWCHLTGP